jgi:alpha-tubulin suppressor-like RCC1 family protein
MNIRTAVAALLLLVPFSTAQAAKREQLPVMSAGRSINYLIKPDGTLWGWGLGDMGYGQAADSTPAQVGSDSDWLFVDSTYDHTVAIKQGGTMWAWGRNDQGQLGNGGFAASSFPVQVIDRNTDYSARNEWIAACASIGYSAGIKADGVLYTWGNNEFGQLGDGTTDTRPYPGIVKHASTTPAALAILNIWKSVACADVGDKFMLAVKRDGTMWSWGQNEHGALGDGTTFIPRLYPVQLGNKTDGTDRNWVAVAAGGAHGMALRGDGTLWTWGSNVWGQLGLGKGVLVPTRVTSPVTTWRSIEASASSSMAITSSGKLYGWGGNYAGHLGDGTTTDRSTPTLISAAGTVTQVQEGDTVTLALKANGTFMSWGNPSGLGRSGENKLPGTVFTYTGTSHVAAAYRHSGLITADGKLWTTGEGASGKLGTGNTTNRTLPTAIAVTSPSSPSDDWVQFSGGKTHSLALKGDGTLWSAGGNTYGQLGRASSPSANFARVGTDSQWTQVHAGAEHSLALKADGTLWAWGHNDHGQIGDSSLTNRSTPVKIAAPSTSAGPRSWVAACAGSQHSAGILSDGSLWTWGRNNYGQLGFSNNNNDAVHPFQVLITALGNDYRWNAVECGENHNIALRSFSSVWAWGRNHAGQLGTGNLTNAGSPVEVAKDKRWIAISLQSSGSHSVALDANGTINVWGLNASGQVGDGTTTNQPLPISQDGIRATHISAGGNHTFGRAALDVYGWGQGSYGQLGCNNFQGSVWEIWCFGL